MTVSTLPASSESVGAHCRQRVELFGIQFDPLTMSQTVEQIWEWLDQPYNETRYVVTPNVDHAVLFQERADLRKAYETAALIVADGRPVVHAAKWLRAPIPECVPGSDLVPRLFDRATEERRLRVFLLGAAPGVADRAAANVTRKWPAVDVVGTLSPPLGFERDPREEQAILDRIAAVKPDLLVVGLGAPKQELWVSKHHRQLQAAVTLCVGATIDFLAGERRRAPLWMRRLSLEWLHRMLEEPRRLGPRYARDAWIFPRLIAAEFFRSWGSTRAWRST